MEIDFEDLVEEDIDPGLSHNYLKVGAEHMKSISKVHIKLQLATQIIEIALVIMTYFVFDLINITNPDPDKYHW